MEISAPFQGAVRRGVEPPAPVAVSGPGADYSDILPAHLLESL